MLARERHDRNAARGHEGVAGDAAQGPLLVLQARVVDRIAGRLDHDIRPGSPRSEEEEDHLPRAVPPACREPEPVVPQIDAGGRRDLDDVGGDGALEGGVQPPDEHAGPVAGGNVRGKPFECAEAARQAGHADPSLDEVPTDRRVVGRDRRPGLAARWREPEAVDSREARRREGRLDRLATLHLQVDTSIRAQGPCDRRQRVVADRSLGDVGDVDEVNRRRIQDGEV